MRCWRKMVRSFMTPLLTLALKWGMVPSHNGPTVYLPVTRTVVTLCTVLGFRARLWFISSSWVLVTAWVTGPLVYSNRPGEGHGRAPLILNYYWPTVVARSQTPPAAAPRIQCARRAVSRHPPAGSTRPTVPTPRGRGASPGAPRLPARPA